MKSIFFTLFLLSIPNLGYGQNDEVSFKRRIDTLLADLSRNYTESKDRFVNGQYNDIILDGLTYSVWSQSISFKSKKTFVNSYNKKVKQRLHFGFQQFQTPEACDKAFEEVLNCLGTDCQSLKWNENNIVIKTTPFIYIKTNYQIIFCKINCEHNLDNWPKLKKTIITLFKQPGTKIISATCGSNVTFETIQ